MEQYESEAIAAFDTLYTNNHIQILKVLLPYFDQTSRRKLILMIKYMEFQYTCEYCSRHPKTLGAASYEPDRNHTQNGKKWDIIEIFSQIKNFCTPSERAMFEQIANMKKAMEMYEEMAEMMQMYQTFNAASGGFDAESMAPGSTVPDSAFPTAALDSMAPGSTAGTSGANPMDVLMGMLSPEQQTMFQMFQSSFSDPNERKE